MLLEMQRKRPQHLVRPALGVHRCCQAGVQALDGRRDGPGAPLRSAPAQPRTLAQALRDFLQLPLRLRLHRLDFQPVRQHPLQLALLAPHCPDCYRVLQPHNPFLKDFRRPGRLAELLPGLERQGHAVNRLPRRLQQQVGDVQRAQLVFEHRFPAFKDQCPVVHAPAQGVAAFVGVTPISACLVCLHITPMAGSRIARFGQFD
jgi:hypothetical protein